MTNNEKYLKVFTSVLEVEEEKAQTLNYRDIDAWDSIGHMTLITEIEDTFDIMMDTDDIIDFNSFSRGKSILESKYDVEF